MKPVHSCTHPKMHIHFNRLISSAASCINLFLTGSRRHQQPKTAKWIWEFVLLSLSSQQAIFQPAWNKHQPLHLFAARPCSVQVCHFVSAGTTSLLRHTSCMIYSSPDALVVAGWRHSWRQPFFPRAGIFCICSMLCAPVQLSTSTSCGFGKITEKNSSG